MGRMAARVAASAPAEVSGGEGAAKDHCWCWREQPGDLISI